MSERCWQLNTLWWSFISSFKQAIGVVYEGSMKLEQEGNILNASTILCQILLLMHQSQVGIQLPTCLSHTLGFQLKQRWIGTKACLWNSFLTCAHWFIYGISHNSFWWLLFLYKEMSAKQKFNYNNKIMIESPVKFWTIYKWPSNMTPQNVGSCMNFSDIYCII